MENIIYEKSEDLVRHMKRTLKPYKSVIKAETESNRRFPFVSLEKVPKLDDCGRYLKDNDYHFNESIDRKISKIMRKYLRKNKILTEDETDSAEKEPPKKRQKIANSVLDLNLISDLNEDLDFEEVDEENSSNSKPISGEKYQNKNSEPKLSNGYQLNGFLPKSDYQMTNGNTYNSTKSEGKPEMNGYLFNSNPTINSNSFKIPKKSSQIIESVITLSKKLVQRPVEAFDHLLRFLSEDQWNREDVLEQLLSIAKNMVTNKDFVLNASKFNDLMDRIKSFQYIDDDFWDDIIYSVEKKRTESKNIQQINAFLTNLHDYMLDNKINVRVICNEAVIIAHRIHTNHPTAKDLIEMQSNPNQ